MSPFEQQIAHYVKTAIIIFAAFLLALLFLIAGGMRARAHAHSADYSAPHGWAVLMSHPETGGGE